MILYTFFTMEKAVIFMLVTITIIIAFLAYSKILNNMRKGEMNLDKYCVLYSLEKNQQTGELEFYFTNEETKHVTFEILAENNEVIETLADQEYKAGGHIVRYDSVRLENGVYFYQLRTDNQKTAKKMIIEN